MTRTPVIRSVSTPVALYSAGTDIDWSPKSAHRFHASALNVPACSRARRSSFKVAANSMIRCRSACCASVHENSMIRLLQLAKGSLGGTARGPSADTTFGSKS